VSSSILEVNGLGKTYGSARRTVAIGSVDLTVNEGEFVSVVGPSGCGKTTMLKCIAGLMRPSRGESLLRGKVITEPPPDLAVVFQDYSRSLFPWLTVRKNVTLPQRKSVAKAQRDRLAQEAIDAVGLTKFGDHYPWQLSGGMQQRTAIARALAYQPKIFLMDEPFASVDAQTRGELEDLILRVKADFGVTILLVTHDIDEAVYMSDRVVVLSTPPSHVTEIVTVPLSSPRHQIRTKEQPEFAHLRAHVYRTVTSDRAPNSAVISRP
jgi:NitT/TauT family transport system ATP-binding protein